MSVKLEPKNLSTTSTTQYYYQDNCQSVKPVAVVAAVATVSLVVMIAVPTTHSYYNNSALHSLAQAISEEESVAPTNNFLLSLRNEGTRLPKASFLYQQWFPTVPHTTAA